MGREGGGVGGGGGGEGGEKGRETRREGDQGKNLSRCNGEREYILKQQVFVVFFIIICMEEDIILSV